MAEVARTWTRLRSALGVFCSRMGENGISVVVFDLVKSKEMEAAQNA